MAKTGSVARSVLFRDEPVALAQQAENRSGDKVQLADIIRKLMPNVKLVHLFINPAAMVGATGSEIEWHLAEESVARSVTDRV